MCEPTTTTLLVSSLAMSTTAALASFAQADQSAKAQTKSAQSAYDSEVMQTRNQMTEQRAADSEQMSERARQAMIETGRLQAIAAGSGTNAGGSNDRVANEANMVAGQDLAAMQANASSTQRQLAAGARGSYATASSRMASIQQPNLIGTGLQIAGAGLNTYTSVQNANRAAGATSNGST